MMTSGQMPGADGLLLQDGLRACSGWCRAVAVEGQEWIRLSSWREKARNRIERKGK
jgi:hypothetical protein